VNFDAYVLLPITRFEMRYGRRLTTTISVKVADDADVKSLMGRAEEVMRVAHGLRPGQENDFSVETADALVNFWKQLTAVLFAVVPAVVAIGIVVGGIVIMNIMLMAVAERTREIGIRKALGATRRAILSQFLIEASTLSTAGALLGIGLGVVISEIVEWRTGLPAQVAPWAVLLATGVGITVGIVAGVYPASQASKLDPIEALRQE